MFMLEVFFVLQLIKIFRNYCRGMGPLFGCLLCAGTGRSLLAGEKLGVNPKMWLLFTLKIHKMRSNRGGGPQEIHRENSQNP